MKVIGFLLLTFFTTIIISPKATMAEGVTLEYIAHASFRITSPQGTQLIIDPFADKVWLGYDFPRGLETDGVLISHPHYDHDGGEYRGMKTPWPSSARVFRFPGTFQLADIKIMGFKGRHVNPYGKEFGQFNTIWLIEVGGLRILHVGDNEPLSDKTMATLGHIDVFLSPMDAKEHIWTYKELAKIQNTLKPKILIPMHYRLGDLETSPDHPIDLGDIEPWLKTQPHVQSLNSHQINLNKYMAGSPIILVPKHWPELIGEP